IASYVRQERCIKHTAGRTKDGLVIHAVREPQPGREVVIVAVNTAARNSLSTHLHDVLQRRNELVHAIVDLRPGSASEIIVAKPKRQRQLWRNPPDILSKERVLAAAIASSAARESDCSAG